MIITLKDTVSSAVASRLVSERNQQGASALGRVMTLVVVVKETIDVEAAVELCDAAAHEHPCRIIVVVAPEEDEGRARLNAQLRLGSEAGLSEVVVLEPSGEAAHDLDTLVLPLILPDTPVVAYWPFDAPEDPSQDPLGKLAHRRITDSRSTDHPVRSLLCLAEHYQPGDTDLAWAGTTLWRAIVASIVENYEGGQLTKVTVRGNRIHPSSYLIAAWLLERLPEVEIGWEEDPEAETITQVEFKGTEGDATLYRHAGSAVAHFEQSDRNEVEVNLARRSTKDCLMEELRSLEPDYYYGRIIEGPLTKIYEQLKGGAVRA